MNQARNQLVLLGVLCQALSWDDYIAPFITFVAWILCARFSHKKRSLSPAFEGSLIAAGIALGYGLGKALGINTHFAIGNGLTFLQLARMLKPLDEREKTFSLVAAIIQIGVGCVVILDARFLLILVAMIGLLPRALAQMQQERGSPPLVPDPNQQRNKPVSLFSLKLPKRTWFGLVAFTLGFFVLFPRNFLGTPLSTHRQASGPEGNLQDSLLDASLGGGALSQRVLMQVDGERPGYFRCLALDLFDGTQWKADPRLALQRVGLDLDEADLGQAEYRRVRVKHIRYLGKVLPLDGVPLDVRGKFFRHNRIDRHGIFRPVYMWNTPNNIYEYWSFNDRPTDYWREEWRTPLTQATQPSSALQEWLAQQAEATNSDYDLAKKLESHLQTEFTYQLGSPKLSRINPIDDFIFNAREGHCERFASALTYLLRLRGIPARVMIGYVPGSKNLFTSGYNIRFKDAHAWTEAYFDERGWVTLDATPRASQPMEAQGLTAVWDSLEFAWYLHIVNYGGPTQRLLIEGAREHLTRATEWSGRNRAPLLKFFAGVTGIILVGWAGMTGRWRSWLWKGRSKPTSKVWAGHIYGRMLSHLAKQGFDKPNSQTPFEFLQSTALQQHPSLSAIRAITVAYCELKYGQRVLQDEDKRQLEELLNNLGKEQVR